MYHRILGYCRGCDNSGYWTLRYWTPQAAIGNRQGNTIIIEYAHVCARVNHQNSDAALIRKCDAFSNQFPRNSIRSLLRILHCDCLFSQTNQKVLYYKQPLCFLMCEHLIYRVVVYNVAICHLLRE